MVHITSSMALAAARELHRVADREGVEWDKLRDTERVSYVRDAVDVLSAAALAAPTALALQQRRHHHESWQLRPSVQGGLHCAACGASVGG